MRTFLPAALLALVLPLLAAPAPGAESNLLPNGGFEKGMDGWAFVANSGRATATLDRKVKRQGKRALRLEKRGGPPFDVLRTDLPELTPGTRVEVSAHVKGVDVGNAFVKFWVYDAAGTSLVQDVDVVRLTGTFDWKRVAKAYDLPAGAASAAVMVLMVVGGELWLDDVRVEGVSGPEPLDEATTTWLDAHATPLTSLAFDAPSDDLEPVAEAMAARRLVLLGEASHGDGPTFRLKTRLIRHLHEKHGFDVLAFEAGTFECEAANALLAEGKVREAMFASVPGVWRVEEVRPLFEYMAASAKTDRPLRLTGFDPQATGGAVLELGPRLHEILGPEEFPSHAGDVLRRMVERIWDGDSPPTSKARDEVLAAIESGRAALTAGRDAFVAEHGEREVALLEVALDNLRLWVEARGRPERPGWDAVNVRDARMAENLLWLVRERYADAKVMAWGATMHFMHGATGIREGRKRTYRGCRPMGEAVREALGDDAYVLGFVAHHGSKGTPFWGPFPIETAPEGSVEDLLHRYGRPWLFVDLAGTPAGPFHEERQAGFLGYSRSMVAAWPTVLDGLVFTDENAPSTVLAR